MANMIFCKTTAKGVQSFYVNANGETHYLFSQSFRRGVKNYYERGVYINEAINFTKAKGNTAVVHTMEKLPAYIRYIEREYGIAVLRKTARKNQERKKKIA
jgi:hypothetical protein